MDVINLLCVCNKDFPCLSCMHIVGRKNGFRCYSTYGRHRTVFGRIAGSYETSLGRFRRSRMLRSFQRIPAQWLCQIVRLLLCVTVWLVSLCEIFRCLSFRSVCFSNKCSFLSRAAVDKDGENQLLNKFWGTHGRGVGVGALDWIVWWRSERKWHGFDVKPEGKNLKWKN